MMLVYRNAPFNTLDGSTKYFVRGFASDGAPAVGDDGVFGVRGCWGDAGGLGVEGAEWDARVYAVARVEEGF